MLQSQTAVYGQDVRLKSSIRLFKALCCGCKTSLLSLDLGPEEGKQCILMEKYSLAIPLSLVSPFALSL